MRNMESIVKLALLVPAMQQELDLLQSKFEGVQTDIAREPHYRLGWNAEKLFDIAAKMKLVKGLMGDMKHLIDNGKTELNVTDYFNELRKILVRETRYLANRSSGTFSNIEKDYYVQALATMLDSPFWGDNKFLLEAQRADAEYVAWYEADLAARREQDEVKKAIAQGKVLNFVAGIEGALRNIDFIKTPSVVVENNFVKVRVTNCQLTDETALRNWLELEFKEDYHVERSKRGILTAYIKVKTE